MRRLPSPFPCHEYVLVSSHRGARVLRAAVTVKVIPELVYGEAFAGACIVSQAEPFSLPSDLVGLTGNPGFRVQRNLKPLIKLKKKVKKVKSKKDRVPGSKYRI